MGSCSRGRLVVEPSTEGLSSIGRAHARFPSPVHQHDFSRVARPKGARDTALPQDGLQDGGRRVVALSALLPSSPIRTRLRIRRAKVDPNHGGYGVRKGVEYGVDGQGLPQPNGDWSLDSNTVTMA